jgi:hypothetical protein
MTSDHAIVMERALSKLHELESDPQWASIYFESLHDAGFIYIEALNSLGEPTLWVFPYGHD